MMLEGKVALVTGGNGGIGLGMAEALAESGADVCIWGRNEEKNQVAEQKLKSYGRRVLVLKCDVSDKKQVEKGFAKVLDEMGAVHACFANAGIGILGTPFHEMSIDEWRMIFGINMEGVFLTFQSTLRHMMERGDGGSLVVTSSTLRPEYSDGEMRMLTNRPLPSRSRWRAWLITEQVTSLKA